MKLKKKTLILLVLLSLIATSAYSELYSEAGELDFSGNAKTTGTDTLVVGLSPQVQARYVSDGTTEVTSQWFAIAALHPGGNRVYATAQDVNNVYSQTYETGDARESYLTLIPDTSQSASVWSDEGWGL